MELAANCYECASFGNLGDGKSIYGLCCRVADCSGSSYVVKKEQTRCIFGNADIKLSPEEISARDRSEQTEYDSMQRNFEDARKIVESWPRWKQEIRL
jgi:hypothetical protein